VLKTTCMKSMLKNPYSPQFMAPKITNNPAARSQSFILIFIALLYYHRTTRLRQRLVAGKGGDHHEQILQTDDEIFFQTSAVRRCCTRSWWDRFRHHPFPPASWRSSRSMGICIPAGGSHRPLVGCYERNVGDSKRRFRNLVTSSRI